jgi:hypothetical protein
MLLKSSDRLRLALLAVLLFLDDLAGLLLGNLF